MKKTTIGIVLLSIAAALLIFVVTAVMILFNANNYAVAMERQIEAKWKDNQNVLSNYGQTLIELAQVPDMYRDDFLNVVKADMEGRYGADGSQATMQWIQERGLNFDSSLYANVQKPIEAGRKDFANNQRMLLDLKRSYETQLVTMPRSFVLSMLGFPKIDLAKYNIVVTADTAKKFETGVDAPTQLRKPAPAEVQQQ